MPPKKKKPNYRQTGRSVTSRDNQRKSLLPGRRVSRDGSIYYERRKNRSDTPSERKWFAAQKRYKKQITGKTKTKKSRSGKRK